ncbi:MAG TPA: pyridoxal-phosphate dependent enzyme [Blastocatellia bacterium]|nr:pyridoxal-phosphate dependent enzyme [Blastocatellia bacterium]
MNMDMEIPTLKDVLLARQTIDKYLPRTPLIEYPALSSFAGVRVLVKHENHQPVGVFKLRGGINLISRMPDAERASGVITASTGNHGQSVAFAARMFGVKAQILVPEGANPLKVDSMRALGAEVSFYGKDFDDAREKAEAIAAEASMRYIHSGNEPLLIAGVGTIALEIIEAAPEIDAIIVPVGGGSGAAGACITAKSINPAIKIIGVQSEKAPAAFKSWNARRVLEDKMETSAEGLATRVGFELPQRILWQHLDDFVLLSDEEIQHAIALYVVKAHTLAEAAGAASLAALIKYRERFRGLTVALVLSGANITITQLRAALPPA